LNKIVVISKGSNCLLLITNKVELSFFQMLRECTCILTHYNCIMCCVLFCCEIHLLMVFCCVLFCCEIHLLMLFCCLLQEFECGVHFGGGENAKQEWSFTLYDFDGHGKITKEVGSETWGIVPLLW